MKFRLAALSSLFFSALLLLSSCEKDFDETKVKEYSRTGIVMSGKNEVPANPSTGTGSLDIFYSKGTRTLSYQFTWSGLTDTITGIHIHGLTPAGYNAVIVQNILTAKNEASFPFRGGSYSGTLFVDGVVIKEEHLLNSLYYLNIHTKGINPSLPPPNNTYSGGEIRAQIKF